jgi:hypothetical protein
MIAGSLSLSHANSIMSYNAITPADVQPLLDEALAGHLSGEPDQPQKTYMYGLGARVERLPLENITARFVASLDDVVKGHLQLVKGINEAGGRVHAVTADKVVFRPYRGKYVDMQIYARVSYDKPPEHAQFHVNLLE